MIDAKDLRVGNWVTDEFYEHFKTVIKVSSINEAGINLEISDDGNISELANHYIEPEYSFEKIYPIELTPEILEKAGFVSNDGEWFHGFEENFIIEKYETKFWLCGYYYTNRGIEYLHQLQNLYYSLTGEEIPIQL